VFVRSLNYVQAYIAILNSFKAAFPSAGPVQLLAVRKATVQRLYFITAQCRIYCCKPDGSRAFLNKHHELIALALSKSPHKSAVPASELVKNPYRFILE
jgi:hypothetical protein